MRKISLFAVAAALTVTSLGSGRSRPPTTCGSSGHLMGSSAPDYGFGRYDGHHEMVDFRLKEACTCFTSPIDARCKKKAPDVPGL
jgi:hypothetical protein